MPHGPNVRELIVRKMALLMIPPGTGSPFAAGIEAIMKPGNIAAQCRAATAWVEQAIAVVKTAPGNPYGDDDEAIAGEILRRVAARRVEKK